MDGNKAIDILRWMLFDTTPMSQEDKDTMGSVLIFTCKELEPLYDKYMKQKEEQPCSPSE